MDEEDEYITKNELLSELNVLIQSLSTKKYSRSQLQDIHDSIEEYLLLGGAGASMGSQKKDGS